MADTAPNPDISFTTQEAIHFTPGKKEPARTVGLSPDQAQRIKILRQQHQGGKDGRAVLTSMSERLQDDQIHIEDIDHLGSVFGGGKKTGEMNPQEKRTHELAGKAINGIRSYLQYTDILIESERSGKSISQIITERNARGEGTLGTKQDYDKLRQEGLNYLIGLPQISEMLPELSELSAAERRAFIEAVLAKDPKLRAAISNSMAQIYENAQKLTQPENDEELMKAQTKKQTNEREFNETMNAIEVSLNNAAIPLSPELKKKILTQIQQGKPLNIILKTIQNEVITETEIPGLPDIKKYEDTWSEIRTLEKQLENVDERRQPGRTAYLTEKLKHANEAFATLEEHFTQNPEILRRYNQVAGLFSTQTDDAGNYHGDITQHINMMKQYQQEIAHSNGVIAQRSAPAEKAFNMSKEVRERQEAQLLRQLETVIPSALITVLDDRYTEMVQLEQTRQQKLEEESKKANDERATDAIQKINKAINTNWVSYDKDTRKKIINTQQINNDIVMMTYFGEDGEKMLMARDLGLQVTQTHDDGTTTTVNFNPAEHDLSSLSEEDRKLLNTVFPTQREAYAQKLFTDYFMAHNEPWKKIKTILRSDGVEHPGIIKLKPHEYKLLEKKFSGILAKGKQDSTQENITKKLKEEGVLDKDLTTWFDRHPKASLLSLILAILAGSVVFASGVTGLNTLKKTLPQMF